MITLQHISQHQAIFKYWFDKRATSKSFRISNLVLMWDKGKENLRNHTKFQLLWIGSYQIIEILGENAFRLNTLEWELVQFPINVKFLKHHFES